MSQQAEPLKARLRDQVGKGAARQLRRESMVPAVIYGEKKPPVTIALPYKELAQRIYSGGFMTNVMDIEIDGTKHSVLPRDYQVEPVRDFIHHVDFLRIGKDSKVVVMIPVHFMNDEESPGIRRGGVLNVVRHEIEVECPASAIPDYFEVDLTGLEIGDLVHISAVTLPENVLLTITDRDFTVATIAGSSAVIEEDQEETAEAMEDMEAEGEEGEGEAEEGESEGEGEGEGKSDEE